VDQPIACALDSRGYAERIARLAALSRDALLDRSPIAGGERLAFADAPGIEERLEAAIEAEAVCCAFLTFALRREPGRLLLDIRGPVQAQPVIADLFA
jgi:hypothetical protein